LQIFCAVEFASHVAAMIDEKAGRFKWGKLRRIPRDNWLLEQPSGVWLKEPCTVVLGFWNLVLQFRRVQKRAEISTRPVSFGGRRGIGREKGEHY
jgi:hypothetical protein